MFLKKMTHVRAPEFPKGLVWLNGRSRSVSSLAGKPVLIHFWTYSSLHCQRVLPVLNAWQETYKDLVIIGVHAPEFGFEKEREHVEQALKRAHITYPVILDNDHKVWRLYANRWWPRRFLLDQHGSIVYDHVGEGGYEETERSIQRILMDIGKQSLPAIAQDASSLAGITYKTTPELHFGFLRGRYGNQEAVLPNTEHVFTDTNEHKEDLLYLHGHFSIHAEHLHHTKVLPHATEYVSCKYSAFAVSAVAGSSTGKASLVEVELDGQPLPEDMAGEDVRVKDGKAFLTLKEPRLYRIVDADAYHKGSLKLKLVDDRAHFYTLSFTGSEGF